MLKLLSELWDLFFPKSIVKEEPKTIIAVDPVKKNPIVVKHDLSKYTGQARALIVRTSDGQIAEERTIENIVRWIRKNIKYEFGQYPRGVDYTWKYKIGDCTDQTELLIKMSESIGIIGWQRVHGYAIVDGNKEKHDWCVRNNITYDVTCGDCEKVYLGTNYW